MTRHAEMGDYERITGHMSEPPDALPTTAAAAASSVSRSILRDSGTVGFLAVLLAIFLMVVVWYRFNAVESNQTTIMNGITSAQVSMREFAGAQREIERQRSTLMQSQVKLLRLLCQNSAKSEFQSAKCSTE
jgi:hypothetical protein